jgi:predicted DNA-binding transcriptional regulator AlpA
MSRNTTQEPMVFLSAGAAVLQERAAASYIGMSRAFLRAARNGRGTPGPVYLQIGRAIRYRISDLDQWLGQRVVSQPKRPVTKRLRKAR